MANTLLKAQRDPLIGMKLFGVQERSIPPISSKLLQKGKVYIPVTRNVSEMDASVMIVLLQAYSQ